MLAAWRPANRGFEIELAPQKESVSPAAASCRNTPVFAAVWRRSVKGISAGMSALPDVCLGMVKDLRTEHHRRRPARLPAEQVSRETHPLIAETREAVDRSRRRLIEETRRLLKERAQ